MRGKLAGLVAVFLALVASPTAAQTRKPSVAVVEMRDLTNSNQSDAMSAMIESAVAATGKFRMIERQQLGKLIGEQTRAKGGVVTSRTPGKVGGFEGVDFLIYGTITSISATKKSDIGTAMLSGLMGGSNAQSCMNLYATLSLDIKITDSSSGEIRYVTRITESQKSATVCNGETSINAAVLMRAAADKIASGLVTTIYPIQVAAVQADGTVVLNYGEGSLLPGNFLTIYAKGEVIRDPTSGEVISANETKLGHIRIREVVGRISRADMLPGFAVAPPIGAIARAASDEDIKAAIKAAKGRKG